MGVRLGTVLGLEPAGIAAGCRVDGVLGQPLAPAALAVELLLPSARHEAYAIAAGQAAPCAGRKILEAVAQACPRAWSPAKGLGETSGGAKRRLHVYPLLRVGAVRRSA